MNNNARSLSRRFIFFLPLFLVLFLALTLSLRLVICRSAFFFTSPRCLYGAFHAAEIAPNHFHIFRNRCISSPRKTQHFSKIFRKIMRCRSTFFYLEVNTIFWVFVERDFSIKMIRRIVRDWFWKINYPDIFPPTSDLNNRQTKIFL